MDYESVELRQLVYFDAVVRYGGFTRAAQRLLVAQPAISAQVQRLETELGTALLARTTRRVTLTHAGELFLVRVRRVLGELDAARGELDELSAVLRGRIRIGATPLLGPLDLPDVLAGFRRRHPGVTLTLRSGLIGDLLAGLDRDELDVALGPVHGSPPPRYRAHHLADESVALIAPPGSGLFTAGAPCALTVAREASFVCLPAGSGLRAILDEAAAAAGFAPRVEFETYSAANIRELVSAGLGVALVAGSVARAPGPPVDVGLPRPAPAHPGLGVIAPVDPTPAAAAFVDFLVRAAGPRQATLAPPTDTDTDSR
jgi:DNA-binding transcriptional LysR family regulator